MTDSELKQQFALCKTWQDPAQWELLAIAYFQRGYYLNALYCFKQADSLYASQPVPILEAVA